MNFSQLIVVVFSLCLVASYGQNISYANSGQDFIITTDRLENAETDPAGKELVQSIQDVYAQIIQVRKDVNRSIMETTEVYRRFDEINTTQMCQSCQNYISNLRLEGNTTDTFANLKATLTDICNNGSGNTQVCYYSVADFAEVLFDASLYQILDPVRFCQDFSFCPVTTVYQNVADYAQEVLADKPETNLPTPGNTSTYNILHLTDVHVDELYQTGSNAFCGSTAICCRVESGNVANQSQAAQYWGTLSTCDVPYRTFEQFLQFVSENHKFDFIVWTGDNIAHDIYQQSRQSQEDYTYNTTQLIKKYFPDTTIYPMFGNHEVYPMSQFDFINNSTSWLTQYLTGIWKDWLSQDAIDSFLTNGYYAEVNQKHNVKIIALNTEACDTYNLWLIANPTDPGNQLAWLRQELSESEKTNQPVFITAHIPPGYSSCDSEWGARFRAIVDRYENIIRGQFYGHTHNDELEIVRSYADDSAVGVAFIAPSFTTYPELNPSYRVFEVDNDTNALTNYYQYRLNLTQSNTDTSQNLTWDLAYDAISEYNLTDFTWASFDKLVKSMYNNLDITQVYVDNFYAGGSDATTVNINDTHTFSCHAQYSVFSDSLNCLGQNATVNDLLYFAVQLLPGQWYYDKGQ